METRPGTETIWSQLGADLRRFIRRRVSDDHVADDLLQETFVRIHRNIDSLKDADRLAAWVYQIARNVIHDHYRTQLESLPLTFEIADEPDYKSKLLCQSIQWLEELIQQLPDKYREAVRMSEIDGLSKQAIAERLKLSLSGAKSRVQRGRELLKGSLTSCCHFEFDRRGNITDVIPRPERTVCQRCDDLDGLP